MANPPVQLNRPKVPGINPAVAPFIVCPNKGCGALLSPLVSDARVGFQPDIVYNCDNCLYVHTPSLVPSQGETRAMRPEEIEQAKARRGMAQFPSPQETPPLVPVSSNSSTTNEASAATHPPQPPQPPPTPAAQESGPAVPSAELNTPTVVAAPRSEDEDLNLDSLMETSQEST